MTHSLLDRQLRKAGYETDKLLELVSAAYGEYERALKRQEHAMRLTSAELTEMNADLKRAKNLAESVNAAKSDLITGVSHELQAPLNSILDATRQLLDSGLKADQKELAETVHKSSAHLLDIVKNLTRMDQ
jgi:signal transduction histidine kinase